MGVCRSSQNSVSSAHSVCLSTLSAGCGPHDLDCTVTSPPLVSFKLRHGELPLSLPFGFHTKRLSTYRAHGALF